MTDQNDFTDQAVTALFDVMDLSCLYAARFGLFAPGTLMARQQQAPAHRREAHNMDLADALGDF